MSSTYPHNQFTIQLVKSKGSNENEYNHREGTGKITRINEKTNVM